MGADQRNHTASGIGELLSLSGAARVCGFSRSTANRLRAGGLLPEPVRVGRRDLWRRSELLAWIEAGCPSADRWRTMRGARR